MEEMISEQDYLIIKKYLNLSDESTYRTMICDLYHKDKAIRIKILKELSKETKENFAILEKMIKKHFKIS